MHERNKIEQLKCEAEQSKMNKDQHVSKSGSLFRCKFKSSKKSPQSTSSTSAVEKARAFFRSFSFRNRRSESYEPSSSFICQQPSIPSHCPSPTSMLSIEDTKKNDCLLNPIVHTTNISVSKDIKVDKINPNDIIIYRLSDNDQDESELPLNYFQQKYKQFLKPSLLIPKQYYNDLLNKRYQSYFTPINRYSLDLRKPVQPLNPNVIESKHIYPPLEYPQIKPSVLESSPYNQSTTPARRSVPSSSSSVLTWNQCVDRLNTEYRSTINALQQTKEYLEEIYLNSKNSIPSKHPNLVKRVLTNSSNHESKKSANVTFRLPSPTISNKFPPKTSANEIEQSKMIPPILFSKPKIVKLTGLNKFPSSSKLESILSITENEEKPDSIASIIKKFNNLSTSKSSLTDTSKTAALPTKETDLLNEELHPKTFPSEEETTTYTIETFYKGNNDQKINNDQHLIIKQEKTTAEEYNSIDHKQQEIYPTHISTINDDSASDQISSDYDINTTSTNSTPSISSKNNNKFISQTSKRTVTTTMHATRLKHLSKPSPSILTNNTSVSVSKPKEIIVSKIPSQSTATSTKQVFSTDKTTTDQTPTLNKNCVKSIIRQLNTNASPYSTVSSSVTNKRTCRRISFQPTVFTSKNIV